MNEELTLTTLRKSVGLTQNQVHFLTGISLAMVQKMEQGKVKPSLKTIEKLAKLYNCSYEVIINAVKGTEKVKSNK